MTIKNDMIEAAQKTLAFSGIVANVALLAGFAWGMTTLVNVSTDAFSNAGGIPNLTLAGIHSAVTDSNAPARIGSYSVAWFSAVGATGCAFMTILGVRWLYHALSRALILLKA